MNLRPFGPEIGTGVLAIREKPTVSSFRAFYYDPLSQGKTYLVAMMLYVIAILGISLVQGRMGFMQNTEVGVIYIITSYAL